jgi:glycosyltransferase involved in cell wall biosynthesis
MNIIFLTLVNINSIEDKNIYTDLLREFIKNGHNIYIISPIERRYHQSSGFIKEGNCNILRVKIGNIQKTNNIEKGISTILIESQYKKAIKKYLSDIQFDLVMYSTPPITLVSVIDYIKKHSNAKSYLLLKDIFPQNAVDIGLLSKSGIRGLLYKYFRNKEKKLYNRSDYIGCMSQANVEYIVKNNSLTDPRRIEVCPNTVEPTILDRNKEISREIRTKYNIPLEDTVFIYGGNLGKPQGVDYLISCLKDQLNKPKVFFIIVGSGTEYYKINRFMEEEQPKNMLLLQQLPMEEYDRLVSSCDVGLIFLDHRFTIPNFPSRLLSYMQAAMPVLAATDINTDIGQVITKSEFGFWCESNDTSNFNKYVQQLCDEELRLSMGANAREYLMKNYVVQNSYDIIMKHFKR